MTYELMPINTKQQSFYGKARVESTPEGTKLISYSTTVAQITEDGPEVFGTYSNTTLKHIKEYLIQAGYPAPNKEYIQKHYMKGE